MYEFRMKCRLLVDYKIKKNPIRLMRSTLTFFSVHSDEWNVLYHMYIHNIYRLIHGNLGKERMEYRYFIEFSWESSICIYLFLFFSVWEEKKTVKLWSLGEIGVHNFFMPIKSGLCRVNKCHSTVRTSGRDVWWRSHCCVDGDHWRHRAGHH